MLTKNKVLATVKKLPSRFSVYDLVDRVVLLQKIEIGLEQSKSGKTKSTKDAKKKLRKWLK